MTDELKAMLKAAKTKEEAKEILLANKSELTDEELEKVNGGGTFDDLYKSFLCHNNSQKAILCDKH